MVVDDLRALPRVPLVVARGLDLPHGARALYTLLSDTIETSAYRLPAVFVRREGRWLVHTCNGSEPR